jgi:hypothetical protein
MDESLKDFDTSAPPQFIIKHQDKGDTLLSPDQQTNFRFGVGILLYMEKHSRYAISNAVRESSKVSDGATMAHWKLLLQTSSM